MGQIVSSAAKPKRCNANQLSQVPTPAAGEYILVSSDNSMNAAGQGNFDCYIEGDGTKAATALELKKVNNQYKKHFYICGEVQTNAIIDCWFSAPVTDEYAFSIINKDSKIVALKNMTTNTQKICQAHNVNGIIYVPIDGVYAFIVYDMSLISSNLSNGAPVNRLAKNTQPTHAESLYNMLMAEMYHDIVITRDAEGNVTTKTVKWIDGTEGTYTSMSFDTTFHVYNGYKVTYKEVYLQQNAVTRDADGNIISRPQMLFMNNGVVIN